jgi:hypothetical protein
MMKKWIISLILLIIAATPQSAQEGPKELGLKAITTDALQAQVGFLASDWTEGRETGEKGEYLAADYIASMLQLFGAEPGGDLIMRYNPETRTPVTERSWFQNFSLMRTSPGEKQEFSIILTNGDGKRVIRFTHLTDFNVTPSYPGGTTEAEIVFAGYGWQDADSGYDDFKKLDVNGKFILRLAGLPRSVSGERGRIISGRTGGEKDRIAASLGAVGVIEVDPSGNPELQWAITRDFMNMSPAEGRRSRPRVRYSIPGDQIPASVPSVTVSSRVANAILAGTGYTVSDLAAGNSNLSSVKIKGSATAILTTTVNTEMVRVRNVIGVIPGKKSDEVIVAGAHYDHVGMYDGYINNGADDNASGTVGMLTLARALTAAGEKPEKTIIFALWTGEEKGLLGSRYYTANPTVPLENIKMHINFDMISRYISDDTPNAVTMAYSDSHPIFTEVNDRNVAQYNIELDTEYLTSSTTPAASDHRSFLEKGIPIMRFKPGHREEYHTPADETATLDWDIMEKIVKATWLNMWDLANSNW